MHAKAECIHANMISLEKHTYMTENIQTFVTTEAQAYTLITQKHKQILSQTFVNVPERNFVLATTSTCEYGGIIVHFHTLDVCAVCFDVMCLLISNVPLLQNAHVA